MENAEILHQRCQGLLRMPEVLGKIYTTERRQYCGNEKTPGKTRRIIKNPADAGFLMSLKHYFPFSTLSVYSPNWVLTLIISP